MIERMNIGARLRKILLEHPEGMTVADLSKLDGSPQDTITAALYRGYGFYVGDWEKVNSVHLRAVWMVVRVPERAPKPTGYDDISEQESERQRKRIEYRRRQEEERERLKIVRARLKRQRDEERQREVIAKFQAKIEREAVRQQERMERQRRREEIAAEKKAKAEKRLAKAEEKPYVPQLTRWVTPQPWQTGHQQ